MPWKDRFDWKIKVIEWDQREYTSIIISSSRDPDLYLFQLFHAYALR